MKSAYSMMREGIKSFPSSLLHLPSPLKKIAAKSLPYSVGIEVECEAKQGMTGIGQTFIHEQVCKEFILQKTGQGWYAFLMDIKFSTFEYTFRVRKGIDGLIGMYIMCEFLIYHCNLNPMSGIHYHVDMSDLDWYKINENWPMLLTSPMVKRYIPNRIIESLESWNYKGEYNTKGVGTQKGYWVAYRDHFKSLEFRIGEMTFDYSVMSKRAIHACEITRKLKQEINSL